jgi:hypothetical protein
LKRSAQADVQNIAVEVHGADVTHSGKVHSKNWLGLSKVGKARVVSRARAEFAFDDLRGTLEFILERRAAG